MKTPRHYIVADLGYGDSGKGTVTDWLCSRDAEPARLVVRYNGGAQAGHNVVLPDGRHHCFSQFGSGTLQGARTHLSRYMMVDPLALTAEAEHLTGLGIASPYSLLTVDRDALLTTPYHIAANRARELARDEDRHGSCGKGIGETARYAEQHPLRAPRAVHALAPRNMARYLDALRRQLEEELGPLQDVPEVSELTRAYAAFADCVRLTSGNYLTHQLESESAVFEGAQGVLLDETYGFQPYTTWSTTTFRNAERLLAPSGIKGLRIGVIRTYMTRHGPGPFPTEDEMLGIPEPHNPPNDWQGTARLGHLDGVVLRYAVKVCGGTDFLAVTHYDAHLDNVYGGPALKICPAYLSREGPVIREISHAPDDPEGLTKTLIGARPVYMRLPQHGWGDRLQKITGVPVGIVSHGPTFRQKVTTDAWDEAVAGAVQTG